MGLLVEFSGSQMPFENFAFDSDLNVFRSSSINPAGLALEVTTRLQIADVIDEDDYFVFFFVKKGLVENEIFQVEDEASGNRIGWCFPVYAIDSGEHDYANNVHFKRYAFAATLKILNNLPGGIFINIPEVKMEFSINASDVMHESTAALVISKKTLRRTFELDRWLPAMAAKGYFPLSSSNPSLLQVVQPRVTASRIKLLEVSSAIVELERLRLVYSQAFPYESKAVFRFFYLYQIVEHLMEIIFRHEQARLVAQLLATPDDVNATKDTLEGMGLNSSEKSRIKLMVGKYSNTNSDLSILLASCNTLLRGLGKKEGATFDRTIYPTRNQIVHRLMDFPASQLGNMQNLVVEFMAFLPVLLSKFALPDADAEATEQ